MDDLGFTVGDAKRIAEVVSADEAFIVTSGTITIYDSAGAVVVGPAALTEDAGFGSSDTSHELYYIFTPSSAGVYSYILRYVVSSESQSVDGEVSVWPGFSYLRRYTREIRRVLALKDESLGDGVRGLTQEDCLRAVSYAIRAYAFDHTTPVISHTEDTLPATDYPAFTLYASGWAMAFILANLAANTNDPQIEAQVVSYRDIQTRRRQQGRDMMTEALARWSNLPPGMTRFARPSALSSGIGRQANVSARRNALLNDSGVIGPADTIWDEGVSVDQPDN